MHLLLICDGEASTPLSDDLRSRLRAVAENRGFCVESFDLRSGDAAPCRGCLLCLTRHPGRCVTADVVGQLMHRTYVDRKETITVFVTPVLFGHPSATIKNAMDRGTGIHLLQVIVGYGEETDAEEESTFVDIVEKHCGAADVVHPGMVAEAVAFVTRSMEDNVLVCNALAERLRRWH